MKCKFEKKECTKRCCFYDTCTANVSNIKLKEDIESTDKTDCFAYKNKRECTALKEKECKGCKFYKPTKKIEN